MLKIKYVHSTYVLNQTHFLYCINIKNSHIDLVTNKLRVTFWIASSTSISTKFSFKHKLECLFLISDNYLHVYPVQIFLGLYVIRVGTLFIFDIYFLDIFLLKFVFSLFPGISAFIITVCDLSRVNVPHCNLIDIVLKFVSKLFLSLVFRQCM